MIIVWQSIDHFPKENQYAKHLAPVWQCRVTMSEVAFRGWPCSRLRQGQERDVDYEDDRSMKRS